METPVPFRIPSNYPSFICSGNDPLADAQAAWIRWLRKELTIALTAYEATTGSPFDAPTPVENDRE